MNETIETSFARYVYRDKRWWYADDAGEPVPDTVRNIDDETVAFLTALGECQADRDKWKSNHDEQVRNKRRLHERFEKLHAERDSLQRVHDAADAVRDVAGTEFDDERIHYRTMQIDREIWDEFVAQLTRHAAEHGGE